MKLHEMLGAQAPTFTQAAKCRQDLIVTFGKRTHHFGEKLVTYLEDGEGKAQRTEEQLALNTTVRKELGGYRRSSRARSTPKRRSTRVTQRPAPTSCSTPASRCCRASRRRS